jgi:hypothetical protein
MPHLPELKQVEEDLSMWMPALPSVLIPTIAIYIVGMMLCRTCGQTTIAYLMGKRLRVKPDTMKQRLRELMYEKQAKRGTNRSELYVIACFGALLRWVMSYFDGKQHQLVLAMDATYLRDRFTILAISVVVNGCAIPVAWHIQTGSEKGEWNPIWQRLLSDLAHAVDDSWTVSLLADGGLYSRPLFRYIRDELHWHPHMRISTQGLYRFDHTSWQPLSQLARRGMMPCAYRVRCFKGSPLECTLLVQWDADCDKPCLVVTDLDVEQAGLHTYALRFWIESGFKSFKRGFFHWEQTKMKHPQRAERLWLIMSIAQFYLLAYGELDTDELDLDSVSFVATSLSRLTRGWIHFILALIDAQPLSQPVPFRYPSLSLPFRSMTYP